jgi:hypothetical protein
LVVVVLAGWEAWISVTWLKTWVARRRRMMMWVFSEQSLYVLWLTRSSPMMRCQALKMRRMVPPLGSRQRQPRRSRRLRIKPVL